MRFLKWSLWIGELSLNSSYIKHLSVIKFTLQNKHKPSEETVAIKLEQGDSSPLLSNIKPKNEGRLLEW